MKRFIFIPLMLIIVVFFNSFCTKQNDKKGELNNKITLDSIKVDAPFEMPTIKIPVFPSHKIFKIEDYGAVEGDSTVNNSIAINKAIDACAKSGGGIVEVPKGKWFTGKIHFKSNVNLHIKEGAELIFSDNPKDYLPAVQSSWEGFECYNYSPLIYAFKCKNIAISGKGTLKAKMGTWRRWFERTPAHLDASKRLYHMAVEGVPVEKRQMAEGENNFRPQFIQFNRCENFIIEDVHIRNSPFWVIHLLHSKDGVLRGVNVLAHGSNNDGVDPEMMQNLLIENCIFDQGDDAIAIKSARNHDGWRLHTPSKNIVMRNCEIREGHQLVAIGSELSGGIENIYVHDCTFPLKDKTRLNNLIFIKTNRRRGGYVKNIYLENIKAGKVRDGVFGVRVDRLFQWKDIVPTYEERLTTIEDIHIKNIELEQATLAIDIIAEKESPVKNVTLENIFVKKVTDKPRILENVENIVEKNVVLGEK